MATSQVARGISTRGWGGSLGLWIRMLGLGIALAASGSACVKARAATVPVSPPLAMPTPPPRVLTPAEEEPLASTPVEPETPIQTLSGAPTRPQPRPQRPETAATPPTAAAAAATPPVPAPVVENPRVLGIAPSPGEAASDQTKVKLLIERAEKDLKQVVVSKLSSKARDNYTQSQRYLKQANDALNDRNLVQAYAAAEKAVTLAAELLSR